MDDVPPAAPPVSDVQAQVARSPSEEKLLAARRTALEQATRRRWRFTLDTFCRLLAALCLGFLVPRAAVRLVAGLDPRWVVATGTLALVVVGAAEAAVLARRRRQLRNSLDGLSTGRPSGGATDMQFHFWCWNGADRLWLCTYGLRGHQCGSPPVAGSGRTRDGDWTVTEQSGADLHTGGTVHRRGGQRVALLLLAALGLAAAACSALAQFTTLPLQWFTAGWTSPTSFLFVIGAGAASVLFTVGADRASTADGRGAAWMLVTACTWVWTAALTGSLPIG